MIEIVVSSKHKERGCRRSGGRTGDSTALLFRQGSSNERGTSCKAAHLDTLLLELLKERRVLDLFL